MTFLIYLDVRRWPRAADFALQQVVSYPGYTDGRGSLPTRRHLTRGCFLRFPTAGLGETSSRLGQAAASRTKPCFLTTAPKDLYNASARSEHPRPGKGCAHDTTTCS